MENESRCGKHKPTKSLIGAYVTPEVRALAMLTSDKTGETITQMIIDGITLKATQCGILKDGEVVKRYKAPFDAALEIVNLSLLNPKSKGGRK